jgi:hypothetical protein
MSVFYVRYVRAAVRSKINDLVDLGTNEIVTRASVVASDSHLLSNYPLSTAIR